MNIICSKHPKENCNKFTNGNRGYKFYNIYDYYNDSGYTIRWAKTIDLIPEPKIYSMEFLSRFGDEHDLMRNKLRL